MKTNLWNHNTPRLFWRCEPDLPEEIWRVAMQKASPILGLEGAPDDIDTLLELTLGEGQLNLNNWQLSWDRRLYYLSKPIFPRVFINSIKKINSHHAMKEFRLGWPIEDRFARFQWELLRQALLILDQNTIQFRYFWPGGKRFALVLTHDVDTKKGLDFVPEVAELEEKLGYRSSFNFVPEEYPIDKKLLESLRSRGFEIGVHGLKHDGQLFRSQKIFLENAKRINHYLEVYEAKGFRAPLMHRNPEWMQELKVDYDLSFFDTDPYEPLPGGTMSIWPFFIGRFIELPYTLAQDCCLGLVLGEKTPRLWLRKLDFIEQYFGMALLNSHPDYLRFDKIRKIYIEFLQTVKGKGNFWHALPCEVAQWWRTRASTPGIDDRSPVQLGTVLFDGNNIIINNGEPTKAGDLYAQYKVKT